MSHHCFLRNALDKIIALVDRAAKKYSESGVPEAELTSVQKKRFARSRVCFLGHLRCYTALMKALNELRKLHESISDTFTNGIVSGYTKEFLVAAFFLNRSRQG